MICAYLRVSSGKQTVDNQRFEILNFADEKGMSIEHWVEEVSTGTKTSRSKELDKLIQNLRKGDILVVSELSRLARSVMEIMGVLNELMQKEVKVFTTKERYELGNNINAKILAFAFSLSAEIERNLISQRTKEALARRKSEGKRLGRPPGSLSRKTKLTGKDPEIKQFLAKKVSVSAIARILGVHRKTLTAYIKNRRLRD